MANFPKLKFLNSFFSGIFVNYSAFSLKMRTSSDKIFLKTSVIFPPGNPFISLKIHCYIFFLALRRNLLTQIHLDSHLKSLLYNVYKQFLKYYYSIDSTVPLNGTYLPSQKFDPIRIAVLRNVTKKGNYIKDVEDINFSESIWIFSFFHFLKRCFGMLKSDETLQNLDVFLQQNSISHSKIFRVTELTISRVYPWIFFKNNIFKNLRKF